MWKVLWQFPNYKSDSSFFKPSRLPSPLPLFVLHPLISPTSVKEVRSGSSSSLAQCRGLASTIAFMVWKSTHHFPLSSGAHLAVCAGIPPLIFLVRSSLHRVLHAFWFVGLFIRGLTFQSRCVNGRQCFYYPLANCVLPNSRHVRTSSECVRGERFGCSPCLEDART